MKILSMDPGKKCGWAEIEFGGKVLKSGVVLYTDLPEFLETIDRDGLVTIVYEEYRVLRSHAQHHTGSVLEAAQCIGILSAYSKFHGIRIHKQPQIVRKMGAKFAGIELPKGHTPDELSAILHGIAYLKSVRQYKTPLERKLENGN